MAVAGRKRGLAPWTWVLVAAIAVLELAAHAWIVAAIPREQSWEAASAFVRARFRAGDRIVAAPAWVDPIVRNQLGDLLSLRSAAAVDLGGVDRIWELSIRGAEERRESVELDQRFGAVRVRMWPLLSEPLIYDFVEEVARAKVELLGAEGSKPCAWMRARSSSGGLGQGPTTPEERFVCDPRRPWLWVGATVLTDLDFHPRRCVFQHPTGVDPVRVTFQDVPLGERLVVHGGIQYESERSRQHDPVTLRVWIDGRLAGELVHQDGDGWTGMEIDTSALARERAEVRFETTTSNPKARLFCWSASSRSAARHD
ncbi:MAG TPA: hypothetical protein VFG22_07960 [Polyangiales bacterium]|nr:hypothetical protein [Polyangiales bacterium]